MKLNFIGRACRLAAIGAILFSSASCVDINEKLGENFGSDEICLSIMRQYTPIEGMTGSLSRRVTTFEYESVVKAAEKYGFQGYYQSAESASDEFIPDFDLRGI